MAGFSGLTVGFVVGLIIGWNVLPQPKWIRNIWEKIKAKFSHKDDLQA